MSKVFRVGLVGLGAMGKNHARTLLDSPETEFVGAVDPAGDVHNVMYKTPIYESLESLLNKNLDYIVVAVPSIYHEEVALEAIRSGVNVFIEKPIAQSIDSAERIIKAASEYKVLGAVGHIERCSLASIYIKSKLEENILGKIHKISTKRQSLFPARISDVGVVKDLGIHDFDLSSWLLNKKYKSITAYAGYPKGREYEDIVNISGVLEDGTPVNHEIDWISPHRVRETAIYGENGYLVADTLNSKIYGILDNEPVSRQLSGIGALMLEHQDFREYLLGKNNLVTSLDQGLYALKVAESVLQSISENKKLSLPF